MPTALLADPACKEHDPGPGHPERPERFDAVVHAIERTELSLTRLESRYATEDEIALCHSRDYIHDVRREIAAGARELSTGDTSVSARSFEVAQRAAGGVLNAVDAVMR